MKKDLNIIIENKLTDSQKKNLKKNLNCTCIFLDTMISIRNATFEEEEIFISRLKEICDYKIDYDHEVLELEDLDKYEYFYASGQCNGSPDTLINLCEWPLELNANPSFDYSNYCTVCKRGLAQIAPLKIKGLTTKHFNKKLVTPFWTYWIINKEFKDAINKSNLSGIEILPLYNYKNEEIQTNMQLKPTKVLKSTICSEAFNIVHDDKCTCNNFMYGIKGKSIKLKKEIKNYLLDFNELEEHNLSRENGMYIISKKMLNVMVNNGIKPNIDIEFIPVEFE